MGTGIEAAAVAAALGVFAGRWLAPRGAGPGGTSAAAPGRAEPVECAAPAATRVPDRER